MNAVRIRKQIASETLHLPELKKLIGKVVEIIVLEEPAPKKGRSPHPLRGKKIRYLNPTEPVAAKEWEAAL